MNDTTDQELLHRYADLGAQDAFTELVRRHCDLVWAAARRVSGDTDLARDVAQTVFTDLARKAGRLPSGTVLAGWLYRAACHAAAKHIRGETRRTQRERQAMHDNELESVDSAETRAIAELQPVLDAALGDLPEADRDAVVLRFLAGRSLAEVGATLGTNEDAAQKRVGRALEKLREAFRRRGVAVGGGIIAAALGAAGTQAAPSGMAAAVAAGALAGAGATAGAASFLLLMKTKLVLGIVAGAVVTTALVWQQRSVHQLAEENAALRQQAAEPPAAAMATPGADARELARARDEHAELLRLRGEVAKLRLRAQEISGSKHPTSADQRGADREETKAGLIEAEISRREQLRSQLYITVMQNLAAVARNFAGHHQGRLPTSVQELRDEMGLEADTKLPGRVDFDFIEFVAHDQSVEKADSQTILFRQKSPRNLREGLWRRLYCMADGSVLAHESVDGDFSQFEREGTGTATNAPKKQ